MPFSIERNDLALMDVDAVAVPANVELRIDGGAGLAVAGAAGLDRVREACEEIGGCPVGGAVSTPGFALPARHIIHAVGPVWVDGKHGEQELIARAYASVFEEAERIGARSVAVPLLSAGTFGAPVEASFAIALAEVRAFLENHEMDIRIVLYNSSAVAAGMTLYGEIAEYIDDHYVDEHPSRRAQGQRLFGSQGSDALAFDEYGLPESPTPQVPPTFSAPGGDYAAGASLPAASPRDSGGRSARKGKKLLSGLGDRLSRRAREDEGDAFQAEDLELRAPAPLSAPSFSADESGDLSDWLAALDAPFSTMLLRLIDERGLTDVEVYKRANMSRQLFSKIRGDANYRPTKKTVLALAIALGLNIDETEDLLRRAGFALSNSSKADVIVEYFIVNGKYDIFAVNEALYAFDQPLL